MHLAALGPLPPWVGFSGVGLVVCLFWLLVRAQARAARCESEVDHLSQLLTAVRESVVVTDARGIITEWNPAAELTFGVLRGDVLGRRWEDLGVLDQRLELERALARTARGERFDGELSLVLAGDEPKTLDALLVPLRDTRGRLLGSLTLLRDVTLERTEESSRGRLEERLRRSQKMEALGQLASGVAHDFNNLLTSILGYAELLMVQFSEGSEELEDLTEIQTAGRRAAVLTRRLLSFSRHQPLSTEAVDLASVCAGLERLLRPALGVGVTLEVSHGAEPFWVRADRTELEQVLMNLTLNARDAMPDGGRLVIEIDHETCADGDQHRGLPRGDYVRLTVTDEGRGMDDATRTRIFEPFFTTKEFGRGTGLGLSTAKDIVGRRGGVIEATSRLGEGSCFTVLLPRAEPLEAPIPTASKPIGHWGTETILVVEDEALVRRLLCAGLRQAGHTVLEAQGALEAERIAEQHRGPIDVLVTDLALPGQGGFALAGRLRDRRPELEVLYISGHSEDALFAGDLPETEGAFLMKPFTPTELQARIREFRVSQTGGCGARAGAAPGPRAPVPSPGAANR